jgi:hypothetical protein
VIEDNIVCALSTCRSNGYTIPVRGRSSTRIVAGSDSEVLNEDIVSFYRDPAVNKCDARRRGSLSRDSYKRREYTQSTAKSDSPSDLKHTCPSLSALNTVSKGTGAGIGQ